MKSHFIIGKKHGITKQEAVEIVTQLAFYAGWPKAWSAFALIKEVYGDEETPEEHGGVFGLGEPNVNFAQYFVGNSYLKPLTNQKETVFMANVTFEPRCRNNWHIHHATSGGGQILICVDGEGWYQEEEKEARSKKIKTWRYSNNPSKRKTLAWSYCKFLVYPYSCRDSWREHIK